MPANVAFGNAEVPVSDTLTFLATQKTLILDGASTLVLAAIITEFEKSESGIKVQNTTQLSVIKAELTKAGVHFV